MAASPRRRRRTTKGRWMKLRDPQLLINWMEERKRKQSDIAKFAGVSRQFIHLLVTGQRSTCTPAVGREIERALSVVEGTLFVEHESPVTRQKVAHRAKEAAA